jgi:O-antigen chain-terminating methyltransferase
MTHKKPVHPETLKFLIKTAGFTEVTINFSAPVSEESRLKKIEADNSFTDKDKSIISVYNYNVEKLNSILFGAQDYAVIGKK